MIVIADPDADHQRIVESDEPGIAVILAGAGLAGREAGQRRGAAGAMLDNAAQQTDQLVLIRGEAVLRRVWTADRHLAGVAAEPDAGDSPRLDRRDAGAHR